MEYIFAQRNSPSDDWLLVCEVLLEPNSPIKKGDVFIELEGAKAVFEVESPNEGYIWPLVSKSDQIRVGSPLAAISSRPFSTAPKVEITSDSRKNSNESIRDEVDSTVFTKAALAILESTGLSKALFSSFSLVTEKTVREYQEKEIETNPINISVLTSSAGVISFGAGNGIWQLNEVCLSRNLPIVGALDDRVKNIPDLGVPVLGKLEEQVIVRIAEQLPNARFIISISSDMQLRRKMIQILDSHGLTLDTAVHSRAIVGSFAEVQPGSLVMDGSRLGTKAVIGRHVFISALVDIEHHCVIGDNTTFGPGVFLSGNVRVGHDCVFGSGVVVEPGLSIGDNCVIASGSIISSDVPNNTVIKNKSSQIRRSRSKA